MSGSKSVRPVSSLLLCIFLLVVLASASFAQSAAPQTVPNNPPLDPLPQAPAPQHNAHLYADQDYTRGKRQFPNPFVVYTVRDVAPLNVTNSPRLDQLIKDGKMYLSMNDAVALALEDNLDIGIQRYNLSIADTDILRTSSGAVALGVNAGLLQGTPGGTTGTTSAGGTGTSTTGSTGGGAGGTTIGTGGAGAGVGGIVASTQGEGPPIDSFDPALTGTMSIEHATTPEANTVVTGTPMSEPKHDDGKLCLYPGISYRDLDDRGLQQYPRRVQCAFQHSESYADTKLPVRTASAPALGVRLRSQLALDPYC